MTTITERTKRAAAQHAARVAAVLLAALLALLVTGCRDSDGGIEPASWPTSSQEYVPSDDFSGYGDGGYTDEPYGYPGEPSPYPDEPGDYTGEPGEYGDDQGSRTNPCAFAGDPLCPDTPIKVPPPNLNPPF